MVAHLPVSSAALPAVADPGAAGADVDVGAGRLARNGMAEAGREIFTLPSVTPFISELNGNQMIRG